MPLPTYATQDEIPEPFRELYEEQDGRFAPKPFEYADQIAGLKETAKQTRRERDAAAKRVRDLEEKLADLSQEAEANKAGLSGDKLAEIRRQAEEKFQPVMDELEAKRQELRSLRLDSAVKGMLAKADAVDVEDVWKVLGGDFDLTDDGKPFLKADPTADIEKHIAGLRATKGHLFKGTQAAGGGAQGQPGKGGGEKQSSKPVTQWTPDEKQAYREQHGEDSIQKLFDQHIRDAATPKAA